MSDRNGLLDVVQKPGRYINREWNTVVKDPSKTEISLALAYPDLYEIGMSNLGFTILYNIVNSLSYAAAERVYAPWPDMEKAMRESDEVLCSLESMRPLRDFDIIGFTLQHEMNYTNLLTMLDLSQIPLHADERDDRSPLVIAGGPCSYNPEPLASFIDVFALGESEELIGEIISVCREVKKDNGDRRTLTKELAKLDGIYIPSHYSISYNEDNTILSINSVESDTAVPVRRRVLKDIDNYMPPVSPVVPYISVIHDRYAVEIMRGCTSSCRFCQAGMIYRPVRERSTSVITESVKKGLAATGYNEVSLVSLSSANYSSILPLVKELTADYVGQGIKISLPSLRTDSFSVGLAEDIGRSRRASLTFAPEAGTQRMRDIINKGITEDDLLNTARMAFTAGWRKLKLYFMIGLPGETFDDLDGIIKEADLVRNMALELAAPRERGRVDITINVASFIPKPHTPFQWVGQDELDLLNEKVTYLKKGLRKSHLIFKWHDPGMSKVEAALSRGDRFLSRVIEEAWKNGCRFDSWDEHFSYEEWQKAFEKCGQSLEHYTDRQRNTDEVLPWDMVDPGVSKSFLKQEYEKAEAGVTTPDCRKGSCSECGVRCQS